MQITSIKTVKNCKAMEKDCSYKFIDNTEKERNLINIYPNIEYQEIKGFGGAFTEAAAVTLNKLSKENREKIIKLYFDNEHGIGYNLGRVHMNSCDFFFGKLHLRGRKRSNFGNLPNNKG